MDKSELKSLCRGNRTDRGWTQTPEGNWTPGVHDRRRVVASTVNLIAEKQGGAVFGPQVLGVLASNATGTEDLEALAAEWRRWAGANLS